MTELEEIQSRNEAILRSIIDGTEYVALPQSRIEELLLQLKEVIVAGGGSVSPEDIQAAIEEYLNTHDADIVTEQELTDALSGKAAAIHTHDDRYYTETEMDNKLSEKSGTEHLHDDRYYTETEMDTALAGKAPASHTHTKSQITDLANASASAAGLMSAADKAKLDGMTAVLNAEILFDSASGTAVTNASPSITFDSGKSLSSYTDGYLEVFYKQNAGTNGGVNAIRTLIHSVSGTVTVEPVQLLGWTYNSANTALSLLACAGTVSNGNTITFSNPENANFSFTIYRIVGYK